MPFQRSARRGSTYLPDSTAMLNSRKWFDRMQPQTLQIATWLLYINGFFALADLLDGGGVLSYFRYRYTLGFVLGLLVVVVSTRAGGISLPSSDT
ncbi:MAG: hypothetical protein EBY86_04735, partial [Acidimicrobiia bacterium]|nr:hypothetical protein [Acidimicrobiia bacterium]